MIVWSFKALVWQVVREQGNKRVIDIDIHSVGKSPLLARFLLVTLASHCPYLSHLALSSSCLAHCLLLPAWPTPSPTWSILSRRQRTFAQITAEERRRRKYPVTWPSSFNASGVPLARPNFRRRDSPKLSSMDLTPSEHSPFAPKTRSRTGGKWSYFPWDACSTW